MRSVMMKTWIISLCLACTVMLCGQQPKKTDDSSSTQVELKFKDTPNVKFANEPNMEKGDNKWLVVEVSFVPKEKKISKDKVEWMDGLIVSYEILLPSIYKGKNVFAMLSGEVQYWAIPMDGKKHVLEGFVPPQILERYIRPGIKLNKKALETNIGARVSFYTPARRLISRYYSNIKNESETNLENAFERAADSVEGGVINVKNAVYSRDNTPWYYVNFGTHDLIKRNDKQL